MSQSQELRRDPLSGEFVVFSPSRGKRPGAGAPSDPHGDVLGAERCPFCPGNEAEIPPILMEERVGGRPWQTRVFVNKYPALTDDLPARSVSHGFFEALPGHGVHEVIVESPEHDEDLDRMSTDAADALLSTFAQRVARIRCEHPGLHPTLFKNHGRKAGATLRHPHAQLIATPTVPDSVVLRERRFAAHHAREGTCLVCDVAKNEAAAASRVLWDDEHCIAFVPYAAAVPFEVMIIPRRHVADLPRTDGTDRAVIAGVLTRMASALESAIAAPSYNVLYVLPSNAALAEPWAHWYIRIVPRFGVDAGFELASGMRINAGWPEDYASILRDAMPHVRAA